MKYIVTINNIEYEVEVDHGKVGVISTRKYQVLPRYRQPPLRHLQQK